MAIYTIRHPKSGDLFAVETGPSDFYEGQDRILRAAGPMNVGADARDWLDNTSTNDATDDAVWLGGELGETVGLAEEAVYGEDLQGLIRQFVVE